MDDHAASTLQKDVKATGSEATAPFLETARQCESRLRDIKSQMLERRVVLPSCEAHRHSLFNMQDYLSLKKHDLRELQEMLSMLGLSSLGKSHFHLMYTIDRQLALLALLRKESFDAFSEAVGYDEAYALMRRRAAFLKPRSSEDSFSPSVMITLPSDAAQNTEFIANLSGGHIDICRINTAHDDVEVWQEMADMIAELNRTSRKENPIKIYVDLAGPKFRTGPIRQVSASFKVSWRKVQSVTLVPKSSGLETSRVQSDDRELPQKVVIVVPDAFYATLQNADTVVMEDSEQRRRQCAVLSWNPLLCRIEVKSVLVESATRLVSLSQGHLLAETCPVNIPMLDEHIRLYPGDRLFMTNRHMEGHGRGPTVYDAVISCLSDDFLPFVRLGDTIYIDDGAIALAVMQINDDGIVGEVLKAKPKGNVLRSEKGINFPDSDICMSALTKDDSEILEEIVPYANIIGISFAQESEDVEALKGYLNERGRSDIGIIAKIETRKAVRNLPMILIALMSQKNSGVMLARGDLAIEVGFENLSRVQEEIFNLCEAAHIPVIYATQILENLMKKNLPSRSEIIDATTAQRADCIMLNKGPFAKEAVETLHRILTTTQHLYVKNKPLLHTIEVWKGFNERLKGHR